MQGITEIVLPEGCKVLAFIVDPNERGRGTVLAHKPADGRAQLDDEWVTWTIFESFDTTPGRWDHCQWGHYFDNEVEAWNDYVDRAIDPRITPLRRVGD